MKKLLALFCLCLINSSIAQNTDNFITEWEGNTQISFFIEATGPVNYTWINNNNETGSGTIPTGTVYTTLPISSNSSKFILSIEPTHLKRFYLGSSDLTDKNGTPENLIDVKQWGTVNWSSMAYAFYNCAKLNTLSATDVPNLSNVTDMRYMFYRASEFNADIGNWNIEKVTDMAFMFYYASKFNADISKWNTEEVTDMRYMFYGASEFNADISAWKTEKVTNMLYMFTYALKFNSDISKWNTEKVTNMGFMFYGAKKFNADISAWNTEKVTDMIYMFTYASEFNADISKWNTEKVTNMTFMFYEAKKFNADISKWNTEKVTDMRYMFYDASAFNQNIGNWDIRKVKYMNFMLTYSGMDCTNYSALLNGWATNPTTPNDITLSANGKTYGTNVVADRNTLLAKGWTILGDIERTDVCNINLSTNTFNKLQIQYYPNPVTNILNITHQDLIKKIEIYTITGQKIVEENVNQKQSQINLTRYPHGLYLVKVHTATASSSFKVTKQ